MILTIVTSWTKSCAEEQVRGTHTEIAEDENVTDGLVVDGADVLAIVVGVGGVTSGSFTMIVAEEEDRGADVYIFGAPCRRV